MTDKQTIEKLKQEIEELIEENRRLSRRLKQTQFFLEREQENNDNLVEEIKEGNEDYQETIRELRREIAGLKHEIVHLTGTHNRLTRSK